MDVRHRNSYAGIDKYAVRLIKNKAKKLVGQIGFIESDKEDLEQELILDLLQRLPKFNPKRAQRNTFITHIVEHKVITIIEQQKAGKRDYRLCDGSLNDYLNDDESQQIERNETVSQNDYFLRTGRCSRSLEELGGLSIDIKQVINNLSPDFRNLCERLKVETIAEISRDIGIPRATIYESIKKLRVRFEKVGLKKYL